jgi:hypothetical protein
VCRFPDYDAHTGHATPAIPYYAGPGMLKDIIEAIPGIGTVDITTVSSSGMICDNALSTLTLTTYGGPAPPRMRVSYGSSANTRENPTGATSLNLFSSAPTLALAQSYTLSCPSACASCTGRFWFTYEKSYSSTSIDVGIAYADVSSTIRSAIINLADLQSANWENLAVSVTASSINTQVCAAGANSFTVTISSNYGNIPPIGIIGTTLTNTPAKSLTWTTSSTQVGTMYQCSGQGTCDTKNGRCSCTRFYDDTKLQFEMISSDGSGAEGNRGDCGYYKTSRDSPTSSACSKFTNATVNRGRDTICSGHGECLSSLSNACTCFAGYTGALCNIAESCPMGPAWFDEPISATVAHQPAVCSNMGNCDHTTRQCKCRQGFYGDACQYMDCPRDSETGRHCSGNGWCVSMREFAATAGFTYGDPQNTDAHPDTWDASGFYTCMCSAGHPTPYSLSSGSNKKYPTVGPRGLLNGYPIETPGLPGYRGYKCHERNCPSGNRIVSPSNFETDNVVEQQRVVCQGGNSTYFQLSFYGLKTQIIYGYMQAASIKAALEWPATIGNVSITFPRLGVDGIKTACSPSVDASSGGFVVTFDTDLGDLPLLNKVSTDATSLSVTQLRQGTLVRKENIFISMPSPIELYLAFRLTKSVEDFHQGPVIARQVRYLLAFSPVYAAIVYANYIKGIICHR